MVLVLRYPELTGEQAAVIGEYAADKAGMGFNFLGITLNIPFSVARRLCELPLVSAAVRDTCLRALGVLHYLAWNENRFFCSQLVLQAYRHAGIVVTDADPRLISPADIMHMREGDVSSVQIAKELHYVGRMKLERTRGTLAALE